MAQDDRAAGQAAVPPKGSTGLAEIASRARRDYVRRVTGEGAPVRWWTAVILTASSARQAERYTDEILRRRQQGKIPADVQYLAVPDLNDERIGSGGATINALRVLREQALAGLDAECFEPWWRQQRVLIIHAGGDSRRLPQYSLSGKLFSPLPVLTPWGEAGTVFDETLALSTGWMESMEAGLVVSSGDVVLTLDGRQFGWDRSGVCGVAVRQSVELGREHGVYVAGESGRVYAFLQKPSAEQVQAAGGLLAGGEVRLDTGLLRFDPPVAARLMQLGCSLGEELTVIDLYEHVTLALTGEWAPRSGDHPSLHRLAEALKGTPFWCAVADGVFTHVGTTPIFRRLLTEDTDFARLYTAQQRLGNVSPPGMSSAGVIIDSVFTGGGELGPGAMAIECDLEVPVRAARGSILHGLNGFKSAVEVPEDTVVHQVAAALPDGRRGVVIRVYGVDDDPKRSVTEEGGVSWFGRPMNETLQRLGVDAEEVWPGVVAESRSLWNANLFPLGSLEMVWAAACWMTGVESGFTHEQWRAAERLSLASSARWMDGPAMAEAHARRIQRTWCATALSLAQSGTDIRPLLAHPPGIAPIAHAGHLVAKDALRLEGESLTEAASRWFQAGVLLGNSGLSEEAGQCRSKAFECVCRGVSRGCTDTADLSLRIGRWRHGRISVSAPARIDFGGGWSDTPPFCLDWGGSVLNAAVELNGRYPIQTTVRRIDELVVRCVCNEPGGGEEYRTAEEVLAPAPAESASAVPRVALQLWGIASAGRSLERALASLGGGIEIRTAVDLPIGSGLGTSSILAATVMQALGAMMDAELPPQELSGQVMKLEQVMGIGGGWQDQAGAIFPGCKLVTSGPGLRQRLRVQPIDWSAERQREFHERFVLHYTGIRRIAKNLLQQVVGSYLAREVATVQVLHSIKTLALEMAYALKEGEWDYLGSLLDRHWELNQILDPHTTNAPINALLRRVRPYVAGAKLAGAGGGGFLMLLARSPQAAGDLRALLAELDAAFAGTVYDFRIADEGLRISRD